MREIKFRAWDKSRQKFHNSGNLHIEVSPQGTLCWSFGMAMCEPLFGDERDMWVLQQYTGLKDKNGVEIYEGDIVRFNPIDVCIGVVKFGEWENIDRMDIGTTTVSGWFIQYDWHLQDGRIHKDETDSLAHYEVDVIGNIHENPELLEAKR